MAIKTFTVAELTEILKLSADSVRLLIREEKLRAKNVALTPGKARWRVTETALAEFLGDTAAPPAKPATRKKRLPTVTEYV